VPSRTAGEAAWLILLFAARGCLPVKVQPG
jgi:hypothetical protein